MKIQGAGTSQLTDDEKAAVAPLRKDRKVAAKLKDDGSDSEDEDDSEDGGVSLHDTVAHVPPEALRLEYEKQIERKRKQGKEIKCGEYRNCDFISGSGAEIERVWSAAEKFLIPSRFSTHPLLLEAILFHRFNEKYWTQYTVTQATMMVRKDNSNERFKKKMGRFGVLDTIEGT
jgi:hypothetical protein